MNRIYERRLLKFAKGGKMKYIGHLDLQRIFQSAIRRAKLPVAYSMGFNPHQRLSFALPLPVGLESICEYIEILLEEPADVMALDGHLPDGLVPLTSWIIPEKAPGPAAALSAADYRLTFASAADVMEIVSSIWEANEIIMTKKTKKGEAQVDIRPDILSLRHDPVGAVIMRLSAGSTRNLSPALVAQKICPSGEDPLIVRLEMYGGTTENLVLLHEAISNNYIDRKF